MQVVKTMRELETLWAEKGLQGCYTQLKSFAKNAIRISLEQRNDSDIEIGASKFGGCPDLPADQEWFREEMAGIPMSFVCQINFAQVKPYDLHGKLPDRGMLYLFYDYSMDGMPWGFDPKDVSGRKVFFYDGDMGHLERKDVPADLVEENGCLFRAAKLGFENTIELPELESSPGAPVVLSEDEEERYWDFLEESEEAAINKLLGYSNNIQGPMELECELVSHGLYCGDGSGFDIGRARGLDQHAARWNLLLQIDSNEELNMMWGDCGRLYLWMTEEDLAARAFENAWLILQCG